MVVSRTHKPRYRFVEARQPLSELSANLRLWMITNEGQAASYNHLNVNELT